MIMIKTSLIKCDHGTFIFKNSQYVYSCVTKPMFFM